MVSQITLINGEKIWVREDKSNSCNNSWASSSSFERSISTHSDNDCNSSSDRFVYICFSCLFTFTHSILFFCSINICVPLFVSSNSNPVNSVEPDLDVIDLQSLLSSSNPISSMPGKMTTNVNKEARVLICLFCFCSFRLAGNGQSINQSHQQNHRQPHHSSQIIHK